MFLGTLSRPKRQAGQVKFSTTWSERFSRLRLDRARFSIPLCILAGMGCVWIFQSIGSGGSAGKTAGHEQLNEFNLTIRGEVSGLTPAQLKQTRVILYFPQLPFQMTKPWQDLEHSDPGSFAVPFRLQARPAASLCYLRLQVRDKRLEAGKVQIEHDAKEAVFAPYRVRL